MSKRMVAHPETIERDVQIFMFVCIDALKGQDQNEKNNLYMLLDCEKYYGDIIDFIKKKRETSAFIATIAGFLEKATHMIDSLKIALKRVAVYRELDLHSGKILLFARLNESPKRIGPVPKPNYDEGGNPGDSYYGCANYNRLEAFAFTALSLLVGDLYYAYHPEEYVLVRDDEVSAATIVTGINTILSYKFSKEANMDLSINATAGDMVTISFVKPQVCKIVLRLKKRSDFVERKHRALRGGDLKYYIIPIKDLDRLPKIGYHSEYLDYMIYTQSGEVSIVPNDLKCRGNFALNVEKNLYSEVIYKIIVKKDDHFIVNVAAGFDILGDDDATTLVQLLKKGSNYSIEKFIGGMISKVFLRKINGPPLDMEKIQSYPSLFIPSTATTSSTPSTSPS